MELARVYVSSTIADLTEERRVVLDWLRLARHQAVDSYLPDSDTVRDSCLDDVATCDLYVLIAGHRYGSQYPKDDPEGLSITQLEFRRAGECGIPRVALLRTSIPDVSLSDLGDPRRLALVSAFRDEVASQVRPAQFNDLQGLIQGLSTGVQGELDKLTKRDEGQGGPVAAGQALRLAPRPVFLAGGRTCWPGWRPGWPETVVPGRARWRCAGWAARARPAWRWSTRTGTWPRSGCAGSCPPRTRRCWRPGSASWPPSSAPPRAGTRWRRCIRCWPPARCRGCWCSTTRRTVPRWPGSCLQPGPGGC